MYGPRVHQERWPEEEAFRREAERAAHLYGPRVYQGSPFRPKEETEEAARDAGEAPVERESQASAPGPAPRSRLEDLEQLVLSGPLDAETIDGLIETELDGGEPRIEALGLLRKAERAGPKRRAVVAELTRLIDQASLSQGLANESG